MSDRVRVGVIGTSWFADGYHVPWLKSHPKAVVSAICGRNQVRAEEVAKKHAIPQVFSDFSAMIDKADLDAVVIIAPDDLHYPMTMCALDAGLHVLCEKPLARTAAEAKEMYEKAQRAGVIHMTFFTWRWMAHHQYLKQLVDSGYIGRCYFCQIRY
jgi:predicted dehydrogenase